jgi:tetratricopeptide (TPR) repeat protein
MHVDAPAEPTPRTRGRVHADTGRGGRARGLLSRFGFAAVIMAVLTITAVRFVTAGTDDARTAVPAQPSTPETAVAALEAAVAQQPDDARAWQRVGAAYTRRLIQTSDPAFVAPARHAFDRADALVPGDAATAVGRGVLALTLHQFAEAHRLGAAALLASPGNPDALAVIVDAEVELGRYEDAAAHLQVLLDQRPGVAALTRVSYLRELHGDVDGALAALRQAEVAGDSGAAFDVATVAAIRGDVLFNHGRLDDAIAAYERARQHAPDHLAATVGEARVLAARGDLDAATALLTPLASRLPAPTVMTLLGDVAQLAGRASDAQAAYAVVRAAGALAAAGGADGDLEAALFEADHGGDPDAVVALATRAAAARPGIHGADTLAWARYRAGDIGGAVAPAEQALRLGTRDASILFHAAAIHARAGDLERARRELGDAFAVNPWFAIANRAEVADLARALDVATPAEWGTR